MAIFAVPTFTDLVVAPASALNLLASNEMRLAHPPVFVGAAGTVTVNSAGVADTTAEVIVPLTSEFDPVVMLSGANTVLIPMSGMYTITFTPIFNTNTPPGTECVCAVWINGVRYDATRQQIQENIIRLSLTTQAYCTAGDTITFRVYQYLSGVPQTVVCGPGRVSVTCNYQA